MAGELEETTTSAAVLIGRARELNAIRAVVASENGRALVEGEPGIGKTALLRGLQSSCTREGITAAYGRGDDLDRGRPFRLALDLAASLAKVSADADRDLVDAVRQTLESEDGVGGHALSDAIAHLIESVALRGRLVLLVDDLQWVDVESALLLARVGEDLEDLPIAIIGGTRPAALHGELLPLFGDRERVVLRPLDDDDLAELVGATIGAAAGPRLLRELDRAGGNPFFALQLIAALRNNDRLVFGGGQVDLSEFALPDELRLTILSRVGALGPELDDLLGRATVLGSEFGVDELARFSGRRDVDVLLKSAVEAGVIVATDQSATRYAFRHDLVRAALYDNLGPHELPHLHLDAARALAAMHAPSAQIAAHLLLAERSRLATDLDLLEETAWNVRRTSASAALALSDRALDLVVGDEARLVRNQMAMIEPLAYLGKLAEAEATPRSVLEHEATLDDDVRAELFFSLFISTSRQDGAVRAIADIADMFENRKVTPLIEGAMLGCRAQALIQMGKIEEAFPDAQRSLELGNELDDDRLRVAAWLGLAFIHSARGEVHQAVEYGRLARANQDQPGMPYSADLYGGIVEIEADEFDNATAIFNEGRARARRRGELSSQTTYDWALSGVHYLAGRWDDALTEAESGYARLAAGNAMKQAVLIGRGMSARIHIHRGDFDLAEAEAVQGTNELAGGALAGGDVLLWARALLLEQQGDAAGALTLLEMELMMTAATRFHLSWRSVFPDAVRLALAAGRDDLVSQVVDLADAGSRPAGDLASGRACPLLCRGLAENDVDLLLRATAAYRRSPRVPELARSAAAAGTALAVAGRDVEALELLHEAAGIYESLGARTDLAPINALMTRLEGPSTERAARPRAGWDSLTPSELRVVELVVEGLTTPQIANRLYVSPHTVTTHLRHVFAKLAIRTRAELAAVATRRLTDS